MQGDRAIELGSVNFYPYQIEGCHIAAGFINTVLSRVCLKKAPCYVVGLGGTHGSERETRIAIDWGSKYVR